jgi:hypothetical protein
VIDVLPLIHTTLSPGTCKCPLASAERSE